MRRKNHRRAGTLMIGWLGAAIALVAVAMVREVPSFYRYLRIRQM
jgi:hypothetical protein